MSYTLYAPESSFRAFATLIAAEYNQVAINVSTDLSAASKSPINKLPLLETPTGVRIFSGHSIARFVGDLRRDTGLRGNTIQETASIDSWMDWAAQDLELPACVWFYPVAGYMPFHKPAYVSSGSRVFYYFLSYIVSLFSATKKLRKTSAMRSQP